MDAGDHNYEASLDLATRVVREAGVLLADASESDALQHLEFELSHEPSVSTPGRWVCHVDESIVSIALLDRVNGPVVGAVCRHSTNESLAAAWDAGALYQLGEAPPEPVPDCGMASVYANVVHVPHDKCPELEMALDNLHEKMPLDITRVPCCCCCEGLFEVVSGRADVHLSPPEHCYLGQQRTPVPVLCAFDVLLRESGGYMSDVLGNEIDLIAAMAAGEHTGGVLASAAASHPYMLRAIKAPFAEERLLLPRLADALRTDAGGFRVEYAEGGGSEQRILMDEGDGAGAGVSWALDGESGFNVRFDGLADGWELDAEEP